MSGEEEEEWCSDYEEEEVEIDLSEDAYERVLAALHPLATAAFGPQFGIQPADGNAAQAAGRAPKRQRLTEPRQCNYRKCAVSLVQRAADAKPPIQVSFKSRGDGSHVLLACRRCEQQLTKGIRLGSCLVMEQPDGSKLFGMVRGLKTNKYSSATLHIQHFSTCLELPPGLAPSYHILGDGGGDPDVFLLTRQHSDVLAADFAAAWARGAADVREPCRLFFKADGLFDYLSVPAANCPTFGCCTDRGCACLNPWAAQGGSPLHSWCGHAPNPAEPEKVGEEGCRLHGVTYTPGDLAWLVPKRARRTEGQPQIVDAQLELVRVVWLGYPVLDDSQESQLPLSAVAGGLMLRYKPYTLSSSVDGFTYRPTGELLQCGAKWLRGLADLPHRAPGSRVEEGSGGNGQGSSGRGSREDIGGRVCGLAVAEPPSAAGGAADGGSGASRQRTPSGSDCSANPSWCSDGGEVSSGGGECGGSEASGGAASPSSGGRGGMQPPWAGQQGPWPIEICDLFCGAGGLSLGLLLSLGRRARVKWAVDLFPEALQTYQLCHPGSKTFEEDVCSVLAGSRAGQEGYPPIGCPHGTWRMLVGGPPCQGFSKANKAPPEEKARKNVLVALFISVLFVLRWPLAIMENVNGLLSAGDTMQRIIQAAVSAGYQVRWRLLNAGCYGLAEHRRRLIIQYVRHGLPMPSFPVQSTLFPGAGGYTPGSPVCLLQDRQRWAYAAVPRVWRAHVVVPDAAPLPAITARDVMYDLPREAAAPSEEACYDREPQAYYAARMRGRGAGAGTSSGGSGGTGFGRGGGTGGGGSGGSDGGHGAAVDLTAVGAPLRNHCTLAVKMDTLARIQLVPKEGQPPPPGQQQWEGAWSVLAHPYFPPRAGNFLDLPDELLPPGLAERRDDPDAFGIYGRLKWCSHFATLTTSQQLYSDTTSTILHPEADRPLTVREAARVQGFPDWVEFAGSPALGYKQVGNAVPPPLAEALGRELARALAEAEQRQGSGSRGRR